MERFTDLAAGVLVGLSRKSMFGALLDVPLTGRLPGSLAGAVLAAWQGASIVRAMMYAKPYRHCGSARRCALPSDSAGTPAIRDRPGSRSLYCAKAR